MATCRLRAGRTRVMIRGDRELTTTNSNGRNIERDFSTLSLIIKCYKYQGYGHVVANCPSPIRVVIDKPPITKPMSDFEESIWQAEELKDFDSDEKIMGDNIEEFSISIPPKVTE